MTTASFATAGGAERRDAALRRHGDRSSGRVALTFDDGPDRDTPAILDLLAERGVRATFFVVGYQVEGREGVLRRMVEEGHEIGNHSISHSALLARRPVRAWREIRALNARVRRATGFAPALFRPPYGELTRPLSWAARAAGAAVVKWDVDPRDWALDDGAAIARAALAAIRPGSLVVLHDGGGPRRATVAALPAILDGIESRGLHAVPASELLGLRPPPSA